MQTAETKNNLIAGAATSDITPSGSHFLYGYPYVERMSEGVHDRLLSSALYLSDGVNRFMLLSNDVIYVSKASVSRIRDGILKNTGIPSSNILVSATHTHSGPVTVNCLTSSADPVVPEVDSSYVKYMEDQIIDAACRAFQNASPAEAGSCIADATGIGTNRHDPEGPSIMDVPAVVLKKPDNSYIACMLVCSMHPTILHEDLRLMSGDFPAFTREILQKDYLGNACPVLYFTGAAGNQSPRHVTRSNTFEEAQRIGEIVARAVGSEIRNGIEYSPVIPLKSLQKLTDLPRRKFPDAEWALKHRDTALERFEYLKRSSKNAREIRTAEVDWFGAEELLLLSKFAKSDKMEQAYQSCLPAEVQVFRIGRYFFAAWPGEIFVEYALELKRENKNVFLITLSNGELQGYIATKEADDKGFYESGNSLFHYSAGQVLVDRTMEMIKQLK